MPKNEEQLSQYNHSIIEEKWRLFWENTNQFQDVLKQKTSSENEWLYLLFAFAYPSGSGLHVGHVESLTALDILARFHRMNGKNVFFPVGYDGFGLPAENYAIKTGIHPAESTKNAIKTFDEQIKKVGISYDWETELVTANPEYYKWTQWIFKELFKKGLAYQKEAMVNWCSSCQTVLANEQAQSGACDRCNTTVIQKEMKQWFFKITEYQDELTDDLDQVDWPAGTILAQREWIGRSKEGNNIPFKINNSKLSLDCFTTRLDTVFGVTFLAISPEKFEELNLISVVDESESKYVIEYLDMVKTRTELDRQKSAGDKTGVDTGLTAMNPVSGSSIPIYLADYVLGSYGTGSVMGVPAHDNRDFDFATKYDLPIIDVVQPSNTLEKLDSVYTDTGILINSGDYNGMKSEEAVKTILSNFEEITKATNYKLRDWLISRQRYWGAPIPIVYDPEGNPHLVEDEDLPWLLPDDIDYNPKGTSPLGSSQELKKRVEDKFGVGWTPEIDTMDTFVCSSFYYLRYLAMHDPNHLTNTEILDKLMPVDFYMIGAEHTVLHLLYSRFFTKFLRDQGLIDFDEPFPYMRHQGMVLGEDGKKMSKNIGNVINPDDVIAEYGADTLRMYEMVVAPIEADKAWNENGVKGVYKFLARIYNLVANYEIIDEISSSDNNQLERDLHKLIKKVGSDIELLKFHTAISEMMKFLNGWEDAQKQNDKDSVLKKDQLLVFVKLIAPFAPFIASELFILINSNQVDTDIHLENWPKFDEELTIELEHTIPIMIDGKRRGELNLSMSDADNVETVMAHVLTNDSAIRWLSGVEIIDQRYINKTNQSNGKSIVFIKTKQK